LELEVSLDVGGWNLELFRRPSGMVLVITLILLSVVTFMAVTFMVVSRSQHSAVATKTDQITAEFAADAALERAKSDAAVAMMAFTNSHAYDFWVSTNYINPTGFVAGVSSPINVNYDFDSATKGPLTAPELLQNLTNLMIDPRPPVFITNRSLGKMDFRYYLDLNRDGRFEPTGLIDTNGQPFLPGNTLNALSNYFYAAGDPQWIGILERPYLPHSATNKFLSRMAYAVIPSGKTLDLNYIYNYAKLLQPTMPPGSDSFLRNQGAGTYEINLAAFLVDLNTNIWQTNAAPYNYYWQPPNDTLANRGVAFDDALSLLSYRYGGNYKTFPLASVFGLWGNLGVNAFTSDYFDGYSRGPVMTNTWWQPPANVATIATKFPWAGSDNPNHWFSTQELYDRTKTGKNLGSSGLPTFTDRLIMAGSHTNAYDRYTFFRLLSQLGTDSAPEAPGKINLNYLNVDTNSGNVIPNYATNFISWTPIQFFTNVANRLLANAGFTFTTANIQVYPTNYYTASVHRLLQLAANIYDATANRNFGRPEVTNGFPSVFRPLFRSTATNIIIAAYREEVDAGLVQQGKAPPMADLWDPVSRAQIPQLGVPFRADNAEPLAYGMPIVIGARKGFPNFNEFAMQTEVDVTRKLKFIRDGSEFPPHKTNQMYVVSIGNNFGLSSWNSYSNAYPRDLQLISIVQMFAVVTNEFGQVVTGGSNFVQRFTLPGSFQIPASTWHGFPRYGETRPQVVGASFQVPFAPATNGFYFMSNAMYNVASQRFMMPLSDQGFEPLNSAPRWWLSLRARVRYILVDTSVNRIVDYVNLDSASDPANTPFDLTDLLMRTNNYSPPACSDIYTSGGGPGAIWCTNRGVGAAAQSPTYGVLNQIDVALGVNKSVIWKVAPDFLPRDCDTTNCAVRFFRGNILGGPAADGVIITNVFYSPYQPTKTNYFYTSWQVNDPLVHYTVGDMQALTNRLSLDAIDSTQPGFQDFSPNTTFTRRYDPWGGYGKLGNSTPTHNDMRFKDPLLTRSDDWDFPTNKLPNIGWLGRVHRGTPWQTLNLKSANVDANDLRAVAVWQNWSGDQGTNWNWGQIDTSVVPKFSGIRDALFNLPSRDPYILSLFTTAFNDNAARGQLSINQTNLAAWSAVLAGVNVLPDKTNGTSVIEPAGIYDPAAPPPLVQIWTNINGVRDTKFGGTFTNLGDILQVPKLTFNSPYTNGNANAINDAVYERIPEQILSLLRMDDNPRFVVYAYGQGLKPADHSIYTVSGAYFGLCTNYQVTAEVATRAVVRIDGAPANPHAVIESFNVLPPD
jgi:hypothetical protein